MPIPARLLVLIFRSEAFDEALGIDLKFCPFDKVAEARPLFAALVTAVAEAEDISPFDVWEWILAFAYGKTDLTARPLGDGAEQASRAIALLATQLGMLSLNQAFSGRLGRPCR